MSCRLILGLLTVLFQMLAWNAKVRVNDDLEKIERKLLEHIVRYDLSINLEVLREEGGRAIAQAVSRWLPTAAARVRARVWSYGICGGQSGAGAGFLRVLRFPLPNFIPPIAPQSSSIIWGLYNRPEVAAVPRDLVPPH
jgi:hypothetical protein